MTCTASPQMLSKRLQQPVLKLCCYGIAPLVLYHERMRELTCCEHGGRVLVGACWDAHIVQRRVLDQVLKVCLVVWVSVLRLPCVPCIK